VGRSSLHPSRRRTATGPEISFCCANHLLPPIRAFPVLRFPGWVGESSPSPRRPSGRSRARPPRVSGGRHATKADRRPRSDRRKPLGPPPPILKPFSERQGPWEPGVGIPLGERPARPRPSGECRARHARLSAPFSEVLLPRSPMAPEKPPPDALNARFPPVVLRSECPADPRVILRSESSSDERSRRVGGTFSPSHFLTSSPPGRPAGRPVA